MAGALMRLPAAELRVIGEANGVDVHGLTKAQIVALSRQRRDPKMVPPIVPSIVIMTMM
jgi:hypothetical protein